MYTIKGPVKTYYPRPPSGFFRFKILFPIIPSAYVANVLDYARPIALRKNDQIRSCSIGYEPIT